MADRILALAPHACVMCGDEIVFLVACCGKCVETVNAAAVVPQMASFASAFPHKIAEIGPVFATETAVRACATEVTCLAFDPPNLDGATLQGRAVSFGLGKEVAVLVITDPKHAGELSCRQGNKWR